MKQSVYAVKSRDPEVRQKSASGGMWFTMALECINDGWIVYGVVRIDSKIFHKRFSADNKSELCQTQNTKYVQSSIGNCYKECLDDLKNGRSVLFSGTPCQIDGLKHLVNKTGIKDYTLVLVDTICHGVPSPHVFKDYYEYLENKYNGKMEYYSFRDKFEWTWGEHKQSYQIKHEKHHAYEWEKLFYNHEIIRPCCYKCHYTNLNRPSDITLGDFWGIEDCNADFADELGVSFVMLSSDKGKELFDTYKSKFDVVEARVKDTKQPQLYKPIRKPMLRSVLWRKYRRKGMGNLLSWMEGPSTYTFIDENSKKLKKKIKKILGK